MEEFKAVLIKAAQKDLEAIKPKTRLRILKAIKGLETSPFLRGNIIKKLRGTRMSLYRLRTGDFRVVYHIDIDNRKIAVLFVVDRKDLERKLRAFY